MGDLPQTLYERINVAAVGIQMSLLENGLAVMPKDPDTCLWENAGYIMAELCEVGLIDVKFVERFADKMIDSYPFYLISKAPKCRTWLYNSFNFYRTWVRKMILKEHTLPDVIYYNITHPVMFGRKDFDALDIFDMDVLKMAQGFAYISGIIVTYFFKDMENVRTLPLGV